jgi:hypothetical protein
MSYALAMRLSGAMRLSVFALLLAVACGGGPDDPAGSYQVVIGGGDSCVGTFTLEPSPAGFTGHLVACAAFSDELVMGPITNGRVTMNLWTQHVSAYHAPVVLTGTYDHGHIAGVLNDGQKLLNARFDAVRR